jgi:hypothetical protein
VDVRPALSTDASFQAARATRVAEWKKQLTRFESDPQSKLGREELMAKARAAEHKRDLAMEKYHHYEVSAAAFEVGIVLASATVVTGVFALAWIAGLLGLVGLGFLGLAAFAPHMLHLF